VVQGWALFPIGPFRELAVAVLNRERDLVIDLFAVVLVKVLGDAVAAVDEAVGAVHMALDELVVKLGIFARILFVEFLPDVDLSPVITLHADLKVHPAASFV
jgi:hypothetical protein